MTKAELEQAKAEADRLEKLTAGVGNTKPDNEKTEKMLQDQKAPTFAKSLESRVKPFSFHRYICSIALKQPGLAAHEWETLEMYKKAMNKNRCGLNDHGHVGHWLPHRIETYGGQLTADEESDKAIAYVKATIEAGSDLARSAYDPEEAEWLFKKGIVKAYKKAQSAFDDDLGGSLVAPPTQGEIIPLIRPQAAFLAAGAQGLTLPPNGKLVRPRITSPPSVKALGESDQAEITNLGTGQMELTSKKIGGIVVLTEEGTQYTSGTLDAISQSELGRSLGLKSDAYAFYGIGGNLIPHGLTSSAYTGQVLNIETTYATAKGVGTNGNTLRPEYGDIFPALIGERSFNMDANTGAWIMRPATYANHISIRADSITAGDQAGPQVDILRRPAEGRPYELRGRRVVQTTNIRADYTKGTSTTLADVFYGIWSYGIMATYGAIQFTQGFINDQFQRGLYSIRGVMFGDIGFEYPPAFLWYPNVYGLQANW